MPTQAEVRRARNILNANIARGIGGPKGFSKQDWARMGAAIPDWQGTGKSTGPSVIGALGGAFKNAGTAVLNTLSVPQAVLFTGMSKIVEAATGNKGMDWSDALGGFSDGYKGFSELLTQTGRWDENSAFAKWGGLVGDIALDPLWFVAPAKIVKSGGTVAKVATAADRATDAARIAGSVGKDAGTTAMLGKFKDAGNIGKVGRPAAPVKVTSKANHRVTVERGSGGANPTDRLIGEAVGDLVNNRYFVHQVTKASKKAGGTKAEFKVFDLGDDATVLRHSDRAFEPIFKNKTEAKKWLTAALAEAGDEPLKTSDKLVGLMDEGVASLEDYARGLNMNRKQIQEIYNGGKNQMGIKFGVGKTNPLGGKGLTGLNYVMNTKIPLPANKTLGAVTGLDKMGFFRRSPFEKSTHQLSRSANEMGNSALPMWDSIARKSFGLSEEQSKWGGVVGWLDNMSHPGVEGEINIGTDYLVPMLRSKGLWDDEIDRALNFVRNRQAEQRRIIGEGDVTYRGAKGEEAARKEAMDGAYGRAYDKAIEKGKSVKEAKVKGEQAAEKAAEKYKGRTRGEYLLQTPTRESLAARAADEGLTGGKGSKTMRNEIREQGRKHTTALNYFTPDEFAAELKSLGLDDLAAADVVKTLEGEMARLGQAGLFKKKEAKTLGFAEEGGKLKGESDIFRLGAFGDRRFIRQSLMREIDDMAVDAGLATRGTTGELVFVGDKQGKIYERALKTMDGGLLADNVGWNRYMRFVGGLKMYLTSMQPQHYSSNTFGDWMKDFVEGNWRHFKFPTASLQFTGKKGVRATKGSDYAKIASGELDNLKKQKWVIGGKEYNGEEIWFLSHMVGLGKGYAGDEILNITRLYESAQGPPGIKQFKQYVRWSARQNATREDATRLQAWLKWIEGGDDPMTAGLKTVRSHFDYADLTDFEKTFLRNFILFYTWSRKNIPYQFKSIARRPGLYSAYGDIERDRPKMPGEPGYIGEMGLLPIPGLGQFYAFAPHTDLYKVPLADGWTDGFRKNVLGATPPPLKQAIELSTGKDLFTGADMPSYPGQSKEMFGVEMPWQGAYALKQLGPLTSQGNRLSDDRINGNVLDILASITGVGRRVKPDPKWEQYMATQAAKRAAQGG